MITTQQVLESLEGLDCHQEIWVAVDEIQKHIELGCDLDIEEINAGIELAEYRVDSRILH